MISNMSSVHQNSRSVYIIAEAGVNHNGSVELAKELIDAAADAKVDAVKFQTFKAEKIISRYAPKAEYQKKTTVEAESQLEMVKKLELGEADHRVLIEYCRTKGIEFLSTPFDIESVDFLAYELKLSYLKIPSGEITNGPYLLHIGKTGKPVILSTGMSTLDEIETALGVLAFGYLQRTDRPSLEKFRESYCSKAGRNMIAEKVVLLHCTTEYPAPFDEVNLRAIETIRSTFSLRCGLSDHTQGIAIAIAAVAMGASLIEKHFTLDRNLPGPDHRASLEPDELKNMVLAIRQVEQAFGMPSKIPSRSEWKNRDVARKSLIAGRVIRKGELFTEQNLTTKRPGVGISPMRYWDYVGRTADADYLEDELIRS